MSDVLIKKKNEVYLTLDCPPHVQYELADEFTFEVPQAKFMSAYKKRYWDGKSNYSVQLQVKYMLSLLPYVTTFLQERGYPYTYVDNDVYGLPEEVDELVTPAAVGAFVKELQLPQSKRLSVPRNLQGMMRYRREVTSCHLLRVVKV